MTASASIDTASVAIGEVIVDLDFVIIADDVHAIGRTFNRHRRSPTIAYAAIFTFIGIVFAWLGNPIAGVIMVLFAAGIYANPSIGFLDRWFAMRLPGNRIGSHWRFKFGTGGISYATDGMTGTIDWTAATTLLLGTEGLVLTGEHNSILMSLPTRVMTPWQLSAVVDLVTRFAPRCRIVR